jgi:hypothetical protein
MKPTLRSFGSWRPTCSQSPEINHRVRSRTAGHLPLLRVPSHLRMTYILNAAISTRTQAASQRAIRHVGSSSQRTHASVGRMSSGLRVRSSSEGSAVVSSTEVGRANQAGINRGMRNAQEAVSLLQTSESGLAAIEEIDIRLREIAVAASGNDLMVSDRAIMEGRASGHSPRRHSNHRRNRLWGSPAPQWHQTHWRHRRHRR